MLGTFMQAYRASASLCNWQRGTPFVIEIWLGMMLMGTHGRIKKDVQAAANKDLLINTR